MQNAFAESFIGRSRDGFLNETLFRSLPQARAALASGRADYNARRPHSGLGWLTPADYAQRRRNQGLEGCLDRASDNRRTPGPAG
jgi:putative transposase